MAIERLLLEDGSFLLLETSDKLLLESSTAVTETFPAWQQMRQVYEEEYEYITLN